MSNIYGWVVIAIITAIIVFAVRAARKSKQEKFLNGLGYQATQLSLIASGKLQDTTLAMSLGKGEKVLATLPYTLLTEYQSTGSSYSGANAGVSFPLFGSIRGHVGGQGGQITKKAEQLIGFNVKIAVSNQARTSGLQAPDINMFGPGYLAAYAFNYHNDGAALAKKWADDLVEQIRRTVDSELAKKGK